MIAVWNKWVKIAAINCAQQDCGDYDIRGTPTVRVFGPQYSGPNKNGTKDIGLDVVARHELEYWYETILEKTENVQRKEQDLKDRLFFSSSYTTLIDQGLPNLMAHK